MRRNVLIGWGVLGVLATAALYSGTALADSAMVSYQGTLRNPNATPVADGNYAMKFSIWDALTAGNKLWEENYPSVAAKDGCFSVQLGSVTAFGTLFAAHNSLWLEIAADTGSGLETYDARVPLTSAPYAKQAETATNATNATNAGNADTVDGQHASAFALAGHKHAGEDITSGTISTNAYSAYADLSAESKIGTGAAQVAAGNHTHPGNYYIGQAGTEIATGATKTMIKQEGTINVVAAGGNASGGLQAPVTGKYFVHFQQLTQMTSGANYMQMAVNGGALMYAYAAAPMFRDMIVSRVVNLNAGDVVSFNNNGAQNTCWGGAGSPHSSVSMYQVK